MSISTLALALLATAQPVGPDKPAPVDMATAHVVLNFIEAVTSNDDFSAFTTNDFKMTWMGVGGETSDSDVRDLLGTCYLGALFGSVPKKENDTAHYIWAVMVCEEDGELMRLPLGFALRDEKIFQMEFQYATPVRQTSSLNPGEQEEEN